MKIKRGIASLILIFVLQPIQMPASGLLPDAFYLQQQSSNSCTLCASTMLIRSYLYENQDESWERVTEDSLRETAWTEQGLRWRWNWSDGKRTVSVAHRSCSGMDEQTLKELLKDHPEGVVAYCGGSSHHAVYLYRYEDSTFYCADPAVGYAGSLIPLEESLLGDRLGAQANILENITAYWFVETATVDVEIKM